MAWLIRMAGLRDLRCDDGVSDLPADVLGDGMSIENEFWSKAALTQSKWVQQMESENELARSLIAKLERELAAEKALADELLRLVNDDGGDREAVRAAYRKARGMQ